MRQTPGKQPSSVSRQPQDICTLCVQNVDFVRGFLAEVTVTPTTTAGMALVTVQRSPTPSTTSSPCVSESGSGEDDRRSQPRSISESFLTVKGAALFLPRGSSPTQSSSSHGSQRRNKHAGDLRQHLQTMFTLLRPEDTIRLAVRLESTYAQFTRYMVVVSTNGRQDTEESIVLGMDFTSSDSCCTLGLVLPLWSDTLIHLDGDGGFSVSTVNRIHVFKPVSVQAMWSALQSLHKACDVARCHNYYPGSLFLTWVSYYQSRLSSDQFCINEWNAMQDVLSHRPDSPVLFTDVPTERERTERLIKTRLREIMMQKDLENVTSKEIRTELEMQMVCNLREFKEFIDNEMIVILGQMDSPTKIFDHVYLGSEWNASNLEELQNSGVRYILNVTREIDNFFPAVFEYHNIRVFDEEATNLLEYWNETYKFISKAKKAGAKCLVHCKMGVSRSASTVIAYAMKEYGWDLEQAFDHVKQCRAVTKPNPSFMKQLEEYQGILLASKQRHNKLWRSHSDGDLSDRPEPLCKPTSHSLGRSDPRNNNNVSSPSLHHFLGVAVLQALSADPLGASGRPADPLSPRPRAGTLAPSSLPAAATPHPPPSLHLLAPPSPDGIDSEQEASPLTAGSSDTLEGSLSEGLASGAVSPLSPLVATPPLSRGPTTTITLNNNTASPIHTHEVNGTAITAPSPVTINENDIPPPINDDNNIANPAPIYDDNNIANPAPINDDNNIANPAPINDDNNIANPAPINDDNNNPSEEQPDGGSSSEGRSDASSSYSGDSIDFFSAREKFLGLALDGRGARAPPTPDRSPQPRTPPSPSQASLEEHGEEEEEEEEEEPRKEMSQVPPCSDEPLDKAHPDAAPHHDNALSVRHIVTEIESISLLPAAPTALPLPPCRSPPQPSRPTQPLEDQETGEVTGAGRGDWSPTPPPSHPQSPSTPAQEPPDWPMGSVRRATKQLEQRLKLGLELSPAAHPPPPPQPLPRSPLHSPAAEHPSSPHSPESAATEPRIRPPGRREDDQVQPAVTHADAASKDTPVASRRDHQRLAFPDPVPLPGNALFSRGPGASLDSDPTECKGSAIMDSETSLPSSHSPRASPLNVSGVTVQESDTEAAAPSRACRSPGCGPSCDAHQKLAHSSQELERIQQTLRELQAFLHEGGPPEGQVKAADPRGSREEMDTEPDAGPGEGEPTAASSGQATGVPERRGLRDRQGKSYREPAAWRRAVALEARIRQAGLTPPSQMKRSASLAKLDRLELSANDLSDWDLRPPHQAPYSHPRRCGRAASQPHPGPDDSWKKQRVLVPLPAAPQRPPHRAFQGDGCDSVAAAAAAPAPRREEETGEKEGEGRGRSPRHRRRSSAERKPHQQTTTVLYNTM
ncbi:unnamed protein product [Arctogadus glacialis]